jgi:hypothetical protein
LGLGGWVVLILIVLTVLYILGTERPFERAAATNPFAGMPKPQVHLAPAPEDMVERLMPPWQRPLFQKLEEEGFSPVGNVSYASMTFFWTRVFISPDHRSAVLFTNWVEGKEGGKVIIPNLEIYSFTGNDFIVTACAQDGAAKLLTGANRPREDQMVLHLKAVFAESAVRPILQEHQERLARWEALRNQVRELNRENVLPSLEKIFS